MQKINERNEILEGKSVLRRFILGVLFGLAVIAPGVSGSTIAIMMGLYTAMLYALGHLFSDFRRAVRFLLPLGVGAAIGFLGGFFLIQKVFAKYTLQLICLFAGRCAQHLHCPGFAWLFLAFQLLLRRQKHQQHRHRSMQQQRKPHTKEQPHPQPLPQPFHAPYSASSTHP